MTSALRFPLGLLVATFPASLAAAQSAPLNDPIPPSGLGVTDFRLDATGTRAVYRADQDQAGAFELYSVPVDRSQSPVRLSGTLTPGGDVTSLDAPSPRLPGARVVYRADAQVDETFELFSAPSDGSLAPVRLNSSLTVGGDVTLWTLSADGSTVVYIADQSVDEVFEVHAVPADGSSAAVRVHAAFGAQDAIRVWITPDGSRVLYETNEVLSASQKRIELYSAPADGSLAPVQLGSFTQFLFAEIYRGISFSASGDWYAEYLTVGIPPSTLSSNLSLGPSDGSAPILSLGNRAAVGFTASEDRLVYRDSRGFVNGVPVNNLFSVTLGGVVQPLDEPRDALLYQAVLGVDGESVLFILEGRLYRVPADGSQSMVELAQVGFNAQIASRSADWLLVRTESTLSGLAISGSSPLPISTGFDSSSAVQFLEDPGQVVLHARTGPTTRELFVANSSGRGTPQRVSDPLPPGDTVLTGAFGQLAVAEGQIVVHRVLVGASNTLELRAGPVHPFERARRGGSPANGGKTQP